MHTTIYVCSLQQVSAIRNGKKWNEEIVLQIWFTLYFNRGPEEMRKRGTGATKNLNSTSIQWRKKGLIWCFQPTVPITTQCSWNGRFYIPVVLIEHQFHITITAQALFYQQVALERLKNSKPARSHQQPQSMIVSPSGRDCWCKKCPECLQNINVRSILNLRQGNWFVAL